MIQTEIKPGAGTAAGTNKQLKAGESLYSVRFSDQPGHCYLMVRPLVILALVVPCLFATLIVNGLVPCLKPVALSSRNESSGVSPGHS